MKTRLIEALRTVGRKLANGELDYNWKEADQCNCGLLARELLAVDNNGLMLLRVGSGCCSPWFLSAEMGFCKLTGLPISNIYKQLAEAGLSKQDFGHLEWLGNPEVAARLGWETRVDTICNVEVSVCAGDAHQFNQNPQAVSRYMLAWADILEEADMEAYETRPLLPVQQKAQPPSLEAGPTMNSGETTMVPAAQQP